MFRPVQAVCLGVDRLAEWAAVAFDAGAGEDGVDGDADVRTGRRDQRPWDEHLAYLQHLGPLLRADHSTPTVLLGDFNQRIPRTRQPEHVFSALTGALPADFRLVTSGPIAGAPELAIDHVAIRGPLEPVRTEFISRFDPDGAEMSDHFGLRVCVG